MLEKYPIIEENINSSHFVCQLFIKKHEILRTKVTQWHWHSGKTLASTFQGQGLQSIHRCWHWEGENVAKRTKVSKEDFYLVDMNLYDNNLDEQSKASMVYLLFHLPLEGVVVSLMII
jgi:hypothetical protein